MEGKGSVKHLKQLLENKLTRPHYQHLVNESRNDEFLQRKDILVYFPELSDSPVFLPLAPGLGNPRDRFGPELEFGHVMADAFEGNNILIIKPAWGGKDLAVDFRPPSRPKPSVPYTTWAPGDAGKPQDGTPVPDTAYGAYYHLLVDAVHDALQSIEAGDVFVNQTTWDVKGLVWWQGWNDLVYPSKVTEYGANLKALMRDLRRDLKQPELPIVIGELGNHGFYPHGWIANGIYSIRRHQRLAASCDGDVTRFCMTSPYLVDGGDHFDGDYHYYGRAGTSKCRSSFPQPLTTTHRSTNRYSRTGGTRVWSNYATVTGGH